MKVLQVNSYGNGGAANACIRLHNGLLHLGTESKLLLAEETSKQLKEAYSFKDYVRNLSPFKLAQQKVKEKLYYQHEMKVKNGLPSAYYNLATWVYDITEHPLYREADIIHLHWVARFLDYPSFFKKNKKPVVWTLHDMFPFSGGYHYDMDFPLDAYQKPIKDTISIKKSVLPDDNIQVVAPSRWLLSKSQESEAFGKYPHHHILYGIDTSIFRPFPQALAREVFGLPKEKKIVLFVADHINSRLKGMQYLLEATRHLNDDVLLGAVGGEFNQELVKNVEVVQLGRINDERMMALAYASADVFVVPSIQDNLPNTVLEALCCGIPAVGFPIGGIPDMITDGFNGLLCEEVSPENLAKCISQVTDEQIVFDNGKIREDAERRFGLTVQAQEYERLYHQLLS